MSESQESGMAESIGQARVLTGRINVLIQSLQEDDRDDAAADLEYFKAVVAEMETLRAELRETTAAAQQEHGELTSQKRLADGEDQRLRALQEQLAEDILTLQHDQDTLGRAQNDLQQGRQHLEAGRAELRREQEDRRASSAQLQQDQQDLEARLDKVQQAEDTVAAGQAQLDSATAASEVEVRRLAKLSKDLGGRSDRYHRREREQELDARDAKISFEQEKAALAEHRFAQAQQQKGHKLAFEKVKLAFERERAGLVEQLASRELAFEQAKLAFDQEQQAEKSALADQKLAQSEELQAVRLALSDEKLAFAQEKLALADDRLAFSREQQAEKLALAEHRSAQTRQQKSQKLAFEKVKLAFAQEQQAERLAFSEQKSALAEALHAEKQALSDEKQALSDEKLAWAGQKAVFLEEKESAAQQLHADKLALLQDRDQAANAALGQLQQSVQELSGAREAELATLRSDLGEEKLNVQVLQSTLDAAEQERDALAEEVANLRTELEATRQRSETAESQLVEQKGQSSADVDRLQNELEDVRQLRAQDAEQLAERDANLKQLADANDEWEQHAGGQAEQVAQLREANGELTVAHGALQHTHEQLQGAFEELSGAVEALQQRQERQEQERPRPSSALSAFSARPDGDGGLEWRYAINSVAAFVDTRRPVVEDGSIEPILAALGMYIDSRRDARARARVDRLTDDAPAGQWYCVECVALFGAADEESLVDGTCQRHGDGRCLQVMWQEGSLHCRLRGDDSFQVDVD
ncbi:uncharacterized protein PG998_002914 [Apiospora kogelbergensis]|uniref:uncharacterized protein n=1 Tax=Apiospora kogelbergensis TaxID=1337665 RepID=UPI0031319047